VTKILLIPPYQNNSQLEKSLFTISDRVGPPTGLYRLAHFIENKGSQVDVFDPNITKDPEKSLVDLIRENEYDIVGSSTLHMTLHNDLFLSHVVKREFPNITFVYGGQEATFNSELIAEKGKADFLVAGEGELPLLEMTKRYKKFSKNQIINITNEFLDIRGLSTIKDGKIIRTNKNKCLDEKTFTYTVMGIDYDKIPFELYWDLSGMKNISAYTSNYCPAGCNFCSSSKFLSFATDDKVKLTSISAQDLFGLYNKVSSRKGVQSFYLTDDNSLVGYKQLEILKTKIKNTDDVKKIKYLEEKINKNLITRMDQFCDLIIKNYAPEERLSMTIQSRLDYVPKKLLLKMKEAGVNVVGYGMENFSHIAHKLLNKNLDLDAGMKTYFKTLEAGITPFINVIHAPPLSTMDCAFYNIKCLNEVSKNGAGIGLYPHIIPFKGTYFGDNEPFVSDSVKQNLAIGDTGLSIEMPYKVRNYSEEAGFYLGLKEFRRTKRLQDLNEDNKDDYEYQKESIDFYLDMTEDQILAMTPQQIRELSLEKVQGLSSKDKYNHELEELIDKTEHIGVELYEKFKSAYESKNKEKLTKFTSTDTSLLYLSAFLKAAEELGIKPEEYDDYFKKKENSSNGMYEKFLNSRM
jgi:radical SAM superfamily enzyme YgiQ (UPF0313 family)